MTSALVRSSAILVVIAAGVEAACSFADVTPLAARIAPFAWAPFVVAFAALAVAAAPLGRRAFVAAPLGLVAAAAIGLGMAGVGHAAPSLAGAGVAFAIALVAGEIVAGGVVVADGSEALSAGTSLFAAALAVALLAVFGERIDVALANGGIALGGAAALVQLALHRYGEGTASSTYAPSETVAAAVARITEAPRRAILAVLGQRPL